MFKKLGFIFACFSPDDPGGTPPTPAAPEGGDFNLDDILSQQSDLADFFPADPAPPPAPAPAGQQAAADGQGTPPQPATGQDPAAPPAQQPAPTPPASGQDQGAELQRLNERLVALQRNYDALTAAVQRPAPQPAAPAPQQEQQPYEVDQTIADGIVADDPSVRKQAATLLVRNAVQLALDIMRPAGERMIAQAVPMLIQHHQRLANTQREIHDTFYGIYPQFGKTEALKRVAAQAAADVAVADGGFSGMTKQFADRVMHRSLELLGLAGRIPNRGAAPPAPAPTPPAPPAMARQAARGGPGTQPATVDANTAEGIYDILFSQ